MRRNTHRIAGFAVIASLLAVGSVSATPFGDEYFLQLLNFPIDLGPVPLTFNADGDLTPEGDPDIMLVTERVVGMGPHGGELLQFRFDFERFPADPTAVFGFRITGLSWGDGAVGELITSVVAIHFGTFDLGPVVADAIVTGSVGADGLSMQLLSPLSWVDIVGTRPTPTDIVFDFLPEIRHVPEPGSITLMGLGLLLTVGARRRRTR